MTAENTRRGIGAIVLAESARHANRMHGTMSAVAAFSETSRLRSATRRGTWSGLVLGLVGAVAVSVPDRSTSAAGDGSTESSAPATTDTVSGERCVVRLHGKSGAGADPYDENGITQIFPDGNAEGWGGRQWLYFPEADYEAARQVVLDAVEACDAILLYGFSNGAAFVAKLYCRSETFDGRLLGVVIDDPVPDEAVIGCAPPAGVRVTVYWTGALESTAQPGWDCSDGDWTCEGGVTIGIEAYSKWLGVDVTESPHDAHEQYWDTPELSDWTPVESAGAISDSTATPDTEA